MWNKYIYIPSFNEKTYVFSLCDAFLKFYNLHVGILFLFKFLTVKNICKFILNNIHFHAKVGALYHFLTDNTK